MLAIKLGGRGDMTATNVRWKYHKSVPQLPSPLVYQNVLYMVNDGGIVTTLHPETGAEMGQGRLKGAIAPYYASPVAADGKLYAISEEGKLAVVKAGAQWELLAVNPLDDGSKSTPAIVDDRLYVRTYSALYCFRQP
jgi:outer membrane protein assembly factor BamB